MRPHGRIGILEQRGERLDSGRTDLSARAPLARSKPVDSSVCVTIGLPPHIV
jgi:hypothetical protein